MISRRRQWCSNAGTARVEFDYYLNVLSLPHAFGIEAQFDSCRHTLSPRRPELRGTLGIADCNPAMKSRSAWFGQEIHGHAR